MRRTLRIALAAGCAAMAVGLWLGPPGGTAQRPREQEGAAQLPASSVVLERGRRLYEEGCSSCHGPDARGIPDRGPSLRGAGAGSADFYLSTGRMPIDDPEDQPVRTRPAYGRGEIDALVAYLGSFGGPPPPDVDPGRGSLSEGMELFTEHCAACHQVLGEGGVVTGAQVPPLHEASPEQIGQAVRIGPHLMPRFPKRQISAAELDSIARYILYTREPDDRGGWGIGHLGPIPEGAVAWILAGLSLLLVARLIGERTER